MWIDGAGTAAVSVHDDGLHVWDICRGQLSYQLGDDDEEVTGLACSRDLSVVAAVVQQDLGGGASGHGAKLRPVRLHRGGHEVQAVLQAASCSHGRWVGSVA